VVPDTKEDGPKRHLQTIPSLKRDCVFTVSWTNNSSFNTRPLIYVLTLVESEVFCYDSIKNIDLFGENVFEDDYDF
jgi:hypothetical protein